MVKVKLCLLKTSNKDKELCIEGCCKYWDEYLKSCVFYSGGFIR